MLNLNIPVFICTLFVQVITKNFQGVLFRHIFRGGDLLGGVSRMITMIPWQLLHQSFYKLGLLFLVEVARHVQSTHYF